MKILFFDIWIKYIHINNIPFVGYRNRYVMYQTQYIFQNINIPTDVKCIIIPFASQEHILPYIVNTNIIQIEMYDIHPKARYIKKQDILMHPPNYNDKFVLSKPPNKPVLRSSKLYKKYHQTNVYKCFIYSIINANCSGGIMIVPFIFWCSQIKSDKKLRRKFIDKYDILIMNIFNGIVCDFQNIMTCCFLFKKRHPSIVEQCHTKCHIYPDHYQFDYTFDQLNDYTYSYDSVNFQQDI